MKKAYLRFQKFYAKRFLRPYFDHFGYGQTFYKPWHVELFGSSIRMGNFTTVIATPDKKVRLSVWSKDPDTPGIRIGNYCLICPGVRISAANAITIHDSCMLANGAYLTDADWHDLYDRSMPIGNTSPIVLEENVWVGDSAIVCKGVTIGRNSIVGAGAVVTQDIPPNVVAAGNPARVVKALDPDRSMKTRADWLSDPAKLGAEFDSLDREMMQNNTLSGWIRSLLFPRSGD